jgi:cob(I)alamin adenosyltransferase
VTARFDAPREFVVPGQSPLSSYLDVARTVVRRAERAVVRAGGAEGSGGSSAPAYLNRLSDLLWTLARWQEGAALPAREAGGR